MSNNSFAHIINPSPYMMCSVCSHYVGDHHDKGCSIDGCDCGNGFYSMARDMRYGELRGYVESFSHDTKIAVQIGNSYHILGIPEAEELAKFIFSMTDVAKMTAIPEKEKYTVACPECDSAVNIYGYCMMGHYTGEILPIKKIT